MSKGQIISQLKAIGVKEGLDLMMLDGEVNVENYV